MRTTVDIDRHLLERLRAEAHEEGIPMKEMLNRVLQRGLERRPAEVGRYRCPTFRLGQPLQPLEKALALADALQDEEVAREMDLRK